MCLQIGTRDSKDLMCDLLKKILRHDRTDLLRAFNKASFTGGGTPEHVASDREGALRDFMEKYFPYPYRVSKGKISDSYGNISASIDAIVINPVHPHTVTPGRPPFFLGVEGVDYAIELKPKLNDRREIQRGLAQIQTVKRLSRRQGRLRIHSSTPPEIALKTPCVLFSEKTYDDPRKLIHEVVSYYTENKIPRDEQVDIICSLDGIFIVNSGKGKFLDGGLDGLLFSNFHEDVLYYFLFHLIKLPQSTLRMAPDVLSHYIEAPPKCWGTFEDLNTLLGCLP